MRLTLIILSLNAGGAERVMSTMANYWAANAWHITLYTFTDESESPFYRLDPGVRHIPLGIAQASPNIATAILNNIKRLAIVRLAIQRSKPQVVISFLCSTNVITLLATRGLGVPVVVSERTDPAQYSPGRIWSILRRFVYIRSNCIVVQTQSAKQFFSPISRCCRVIPNPVSLPSGKDGSQQSQLPKATKIILGMGRLAEEKGFDLLLQAFALIASDYPDWILTIFGEGDMRASLEAQRVYLHLEHQVSFPGLTQQPHDVIRQANLFVLSSRTEGFPNVLCEAMAHGLPVISFDCSPGPREIIRDGIDGILVPNGDIDALAQAMAKLMRDADERQRLATRAPEVLERFGLEKVMGMWEDVLAEVVQ